MCPAQTTPPSCRLTLPTTSSANVHGHSRASQGHCTAMKHLTSRPVTLPSMSSLLSNSILLVANARAMELLLCSFSHMSCQIHECIPSAALAKYEGSSKIHGNFKNKQKNYVWISIVLPPKQSELLVPFVYRLFEVLW